MMIISRRADETDQDFAARAFRWNRLCGKAFEDRQARHALCNCNQGRLACNCELLASLDDLPKVDRTLQPMARPMTRDELRACGTPLAFGPTHRISRVRAIWYGAGLVLAVSLIAMAVFGMGQ
jgi:hypothetical protein